MARGDTTEQGDRGRFHRIVSRDPHEPGFFLCAFNEAGTLEAFQVEIHDRGARKGTAFLYFPRGRVVPILFTEGPDKGQDLFSLIALAWHIEQIYD